MVIKTIFIILCLFFLNSAIFQQNYWVRKPSPTNNLLISSFFTDSLNGWVCGDMGTVIRTSNGGQNWVTQNTGISNLKINDIYFVNSNTGWALCNDYLFIGSIFLKTTNGGNEWSFSRLPDSVNVYESMYFLNINTGYLTGQSGKIIKTTNSGTNWTFCNFDTSVCYSQFSKLDIFFSDAQTGYCSGGIMDFVGMIWKTTNAGNNWQSFCITPEPLNKIKKLSDGRIFAMGGDYEFGSSSVVSTNGGINWISSLTGCFGAATSFDMRTPAEYWAVLSFSDLIAVNTDSMKPGSNWVCIQVPDTCALYDIKFLSPSLGWAFGTKGSIFKYNSQISGIGPSETFPYGYSLDQNYPNPFNPVTLITYSIPESEHVVISIYNAAGVLIKKFDEGYKASGKYRFEFSPGNLASGVYFYEMSAGKFSACKKMVLIK